MGNQRFNHWGTFLKNQRQGIQVWCYTDHVFWPKPPIGCSCSKYIKSIGFCSSSQLRGGWGGKTMGPAVRRPSSAPRFPHPLVNQVMSLEISNTGDAHPPHCTGLRCASEETTQQSPAGTVHYWTVNSMCCNYGNLTKRFLRPILALLKVYLLNRISKCKIGVSLRFRILRDGFINSDFWF